MVKFISTMMKTLALVCVFVTITEGISLTDVKCRFVEGGGAGRLAVAMDRRLHRPDCIKACIKRRNEVDHTINGVRTLYDWAPGCWCISDARPSTLLGKDGLAHCIFEPAGQRCNGKDEDCCTEKNPCLWGDGDCDYDNQCYGDLVCGEKNCAWGGDDDCCMRLDKRCNGDDEGCCTKEKPCLYGDGDCDEDNQCNGSLVCGTNNCPWGDDDDCCREPGQRCNGLDDDCCTEKNPCVLGDGDCDNDKQCAGDLVCGEKNCAWGDDDDCCIRLDKRCNGVDEGCCTKEKPCLSGDGDCDEDNQCAGSLVCGTNNCPWGDDDDCCRPSFKDFFKDDERPAAKYHDA